MHTDEKNAIRYLMKEMDPSEELEFEKLMRQDENLLIEVESLRATKRKLSGLPKKNPPRKITDKIAYDAKQLQLKRVQNHKNFPFFFKRGMAAAILLAAFTGGYYFYSDFDEAPQKSVPAMTEINGIEPWVDRNDVLRFSENQRPSESSAMQADFTKSYEKLQLVDDPRANAGGNSGITLTGTSK